MNFIIEDCENTADNFEAIKALLHKVYVTEGFTNSDRAEVIFEPS